VSSAPRRPWRLRRVPPDLERRYVEAGLWSEETLGETVAHRLARHPQAEVAIGSRARGWKGTYAGVEVEDLRIVDDFPRTASGKIRKVDLRAQLRSEAPGRGAG